LPSSINRLLPGFERGEDFRMRDRNRVRIGRSLAAHEGDSRAALERAFAAELAQPQFRSLQVDQDRDRPPDLVLDPTHDIDQPLQVRVGRMAHVDTEDVDTGQKQRAQLLGSPARRPEGRNDLDHAASAHRT
jgi:hypothetical protein